MTHLSIRSLLEDREDRRRLWRKKYLNIDSIVKFKIDFVHILCLPLYSFYADGIGSQSDVDVLQVNCINRQVNYILLVLCFTASLSPKDYKCDVSAIARGDEWERIGVYLRDEAFAMTSCVQCDEEQAI
jgi:hypothetical protein